MLLPYFYALRDKGVYSEYSHQITSWAIQDFCRELPGGMNDCLAEIREMALRLYGRLTQGKSRYFLDKAALYHLIVDEIIQTFDEGKFIFLWRNPLAIIASFMDSWENGRWNIYHYEISLYRGLANLTAAYEKYSDRVCAIRFEDVVNRGPSTWSGVFNYLDLEFMPDILTDFTKVRLHGRVGDQWGIRQYKTLSTIPLDKWKLSLGNPLRKRWCRRYLMWLGKERLAMMGYDQDELLDQLDSLPFSLNHMGSDLVRFPLGSVYRVLELRMLKNKLEAARSGRRLYIHT